MRSRRTSVSMRPASALGSRRPDISLRSRRTSVSLRACSALRACRTRSAACVKQRVDRAVLSRSVRVILLCDQIVIHSRHARRTDPPSSGRERNRDRRPDVEERRCEARLGVHDRLAVRPDRRIRPKTRKVDRPRTYKQLLPPLLLAPERVLQTLGRKDVRPHLDVFSHRQLVRVRHHAGIHEHVSHRRPRRPTRPVL